MSKKLEKQAQYNKTIYKERIPTRKRVRFAPTSATQDRVRRIKEKYRNMRRQQTGSELPEQ